MRDKVVEVQNLGDDLIKNRGEHCKTQIEPKLNQLSQRFEMVTRRILNGQVIKIVETCEKLYTLFLSNLNINQKLTDNMLI